MSALNHVLEVVWSAGMERRGECSGLAGDGLGSSLSGTGHGDVLPHTPDPHQATVGDALHTQRHWADGDAQEDMGRGLPRLLFGRGSNRNFGTSRRPTFRGRRIG